MKKRIKISQDDINTWKDIRNNVLEEFSEKLKDFEIYKDLLSKVDVWRLNNDELCDFIEEKMKERIDKIKKEMEGGELNGK